jgi:hypothetical protein
MKETYKTSNINGLPYKTIQRKDFHIGSHCDKETAATIVCKKCGADKFMVGKGTYFTALKCLTCKWEDCIHEG